MKSRPWRLPWTLGSVPHALIDVLRGCNMACRACYNMDEPRVKPLAQVREEFEFLCGQRQLDSVSLVGGEPTLHPDLYEIVRMIKERGVSVELFTNGLLLEPCLATDLRAAGVDLVFLHIDVHQERPDLAMDDLAACDRAEDDRAGAIRVLRVEKAEVVARAGMEVGLAVTAYQDGLAEIDEAVRFVLCSPHVDYLLVTLHRDVPAIGPLQGDLETGIRSVGEVERSEVEQGGGDDRFNNDVIARRLRDMLGLEPFAYLGSSRDPTDPRWLSYMAAAVVREDRSACWEALSPSGIERLYVAIHKRLKGRHPFFVPHSPGRFRLQLLLNGLTGGRLGRNLRALSRSLRRGSTLRAKRLLFQCPAYVADDGSLVHCDSCPDATVRNGRLVPVCVGDQFDAVSDC